MSLALVQFALETQRVGTARGLLGSVVLLGDVSADQCHPPGNDKINVADWISSARDVLGKAVRRTECQPGQLGQHLLVVQKGSRINDGHLVQRVSRSIV